MYSLVPSDISLFLSFLLFCFVFVFWRKRGWRGRRKEGEEEYKGSSKEQVKNSGAMMRQGVSHVCNLSFPPRPYIRREVKLHDKKKATNINQVCFNPEIFGVPKPPS